MAGRAPSQNPAVLAGGNLDINMGLYVALDVVIGFTGLAGALALATLGVQLARPDQRTFVKKASRSEGTYFLPHSPTLAPITIAINSAVSMAAAFVLKAFLWRGSNTFVIQRLSLFLPMPLLLWAWLSACSHAFSWHLTPTSESKRLNRLRMSPLVLNLVCWLVPVAVLAVQTGIIINWPIAQAVATERSKELKTLLETHSAQEEIIKDAQAALDASLRHAERFYKAVWGVWAAAYSGCWLIYAIYSSLLIALLGRQLDFVNNAIGSNGAEGVEEKETKGAVFRTIRRASSMISLSTIRNNTLVSRKITKRELLARNTKLVVIELASFSFFIVAWVVLALTKSILGYRILNNKKTGPITVVCQIMFSSAFAAVACALMLIRGINILRNRTAAPVMTPSTSSETDTADRRNSTTVVQEKSKGIAARRGKKALTIPLNVGNLVIPSVVTTPVTEDMHRTAIPVLHPVLTQKGSEPEEMSPDEDGFFGPDMSQVRRKTSVSFADQVAFSSSLHQQEPSQLQSIIGSPVIQPVSPAPTWGPPPNWGTSNTSEGQRDMPGS